MKKLLLFLFISLLIFPITAQEKEDKYEWINFEETIWNGNPDEVKECITLNIHLAYDTIRWNRNIQYAVERAAEKGYTNLLRWLADYRNTADIIALNQMVLLIKAIDNQYPETVTYILKEIDKGRPLNDYIEWGYPLPLNIAASNGDLPMMELLAKHFAEDENLDYCLECAIEPASMGQHFEIINYLMNRLGKIKDPNQYLWEAVQANHPEMIYFWHRHGADVNDVNQYTNRSLLMEAAHYRSKEAVEALLLLGADVNAKDRRKATALMYAGSKGTTLIIETLLNHGAVLDAVDCNGDNALMYAARTGKVENTELFLSKGLSVHYRNNYQRTPLMMALYREPDEAGDDYHVDLHQNALNSTACLIWHGADVNAQDHEGMTPLMFAVMNRYPKAVEQLLESRADLTIRNKSGNDARSFFPGDYYEEEDWKLAELLRIDDLSPLQSLQDQEDEPERPVVYADGKPVGHLFKTTRDDWGEEKFYTMDTITIFSQEIVVHSDVWLAGHNDGTTYFSSAWEIYPETISKNKFRLRFQSRLSGTMVWLEFHRKGSKVYLWEILELWPTSSYTIYLGEEHGAIAYTATGIARKKMRQLIHTPIILNEYFTLEAFQEFEIYYCPRDTYDFERCIKCMNRNHKFRFKDFEYGGNSYQLPFLNKKIKKMARKWPEED